MRGFTGSEKSEYWSEFDILNLICKTGNVQKMYPSVILLKKRTREAPASPKRPFISLL